jgi:hypothetical protein
VNFSRDRMWLSAQTHLNGVKATNSTQASHQERTQRSGTPHYKKEKRTIKSENSSATPKKVSDSSTGPKKVCTRFVQ